ncbi:methyltransferase domain-containing protein [Bacteroidia bacterium]|nr:methyltransferase domain-containing protein [Bacteroidia bacterium]MDB9883166.1 methyltransferase domain-containing protein [Bacteroidia bacterium]MDC1395590.1 methyltransferase domain-containing protein [Bacteroidia bacterium]
MLNSYNRIAPFYSILSRIVYGKSLIHIQEKLVSYLPKEGNILILGGGDGAVLPYLFKHAPLLSISYVESSSQMIELASKKTNSGQQITFYHNDDFSVDEQQIDFIFAAFFFDLFDEEKIRSIIHSLEDNCNCTNGIRWFIADFDLSDISKNVWIRKFQIKLSITFFVLSTQHKTRNLPLIFNAFDKTGYKTLNKSTIKNGFLRAEVFYK